MASPSKQAGFTLTSTLFALLIAALVAILAVNELRRKMDESAAEATARYLMQIRGAMVNLQIKHEAWLRGEDLTTAPAGTYPTPPAWVWQAAGGAEVIHGNIADLIAQQVLPADTPIFTPLGDRAGFVLVRQGTCPGVDCQLQAFAYTCHPISRQPSTRSGATCAAPSSARATANLALLGHVMQHADGYGGHDVYTDNIIRGKLFQANRTWFPISTNQGHAVVTASLDTTPFGQFVRQGDTRHVVLRNQLSVDGAIQTNTGLLFGNAVTPGDACTDNGMYGSTGTTLAVCLGGTWSPLANQIVDGAYNNLVHDAYVPPPTCPAPMTAWRHIALSATDVTITGGNLNIYGGTGGGISGSGWVNNSGSVSISGSFNGSFTADGASTVRASQTVSISAANRIVISPPGPQARATVIQGCKS